MLDFARANKDPRYSTSFYQGQRSIRAPEPLLSDYRDHVVAETVASFAASGAVQLTNMRIEPRSSNLVMDTTWEDDEGVHEMSYDRWFFDVHGTISWQPDAVRKVDKLKQSPRNPWDVERAR